MNTSRIMLRSFSKVLFSMAIIASLSAIYYAHAQKPASAPSSKIAPWVLDHTANGQQAEFFVVLSDQADLSGAAALPTKNEKGRYVYDALRNKSQTTQGPIQQWLRERGLEHRSFYIINAILVTGSRDIAELRSRPSFVRITNAGVRESHVHDVSITKEAPNYRVS